MDAAFVSQVLSLIPDRIVRTHSGLPFLPEAGALRHPEKLQLVAGFLNWLTPLASLSKEHQQALGLLREGRELEEEAEEAEAKDPEAEEEGAEEPMALEEDGADALEYMEAETALGAGAPLAVSAP